ncbi:MAG: hypothetical protein K8R40_13405 [Anaerolineaceae bacterium]|nr:hypothetical protein [Anaerolineaceae bacterium]
MSHSSSFQSQEILIEPYCILCQGLTSHVERRTVTIDYSTTKYAEGKQHISYSTLTVPFPVHPECLKRAERHWRARVLGLIPIVLGIAAYLLTFISGDVEEPWACLAGFLLPALSLGAFLYNETKKRTDQEINAKVIHYHKTHVRANPSSQDS